MRLLTYALTVLVVFVAETAGSTFTVDEEANGAVRSTLSAFPRTNETLPIASRTRTSHDDPVVTTKGEGQQNGEERGISVGTLINSLKKCPHYETDGIIDNFVSRMSKSGVVANTRITNEQAFVDELRKVFQTKKGEQLWDYEHVTASLTTTNGIDGAAGHKVEFEGLIKALLTLREKPGMTSHADYIHRDLIYRFGHRFKQSLIDTYAKAKVTPSEFVDMMWNEKDGPLLNNGVTSFAKYEKFFHNSRFAKKYASAYNQIPGHSKVDLDRFEKDIDEKLKSLKSHETTTGMEENLLHETTV